MPWWSLRTAAEGRHQRVRDAAPVRKLSDAFEEAQAAAVEWDGLRVHSMFRIVGVAPGSRVRIRFDRSNGDRLQGLRLKVSGGALEVARQEAENVVLWVDSAPPEVTATVVASDDSVEIGIWNCWRDQRGTVHAWIGNAGMLVEDEGEGVLLFRCSDGFGDVTFDDLVVSVAMAPPGP